VTIIIVNWNGERFLERCLSALLAQTVVPHEIILVDNASSDTSLDVVRRFPSVRLLTQNENLGFARANNLAIKAATAGSEWIVLLNPDAFVEPGWLEALLSAARNYPTFDVFGSKLMDAANPAVLDGAGDTYHMSGLVWRVGQGLPVSSVSDQVRPIFSPCAAAALYRKDVLLEAGGFDEDFFCYVEDVDLGFRLRMLGHRCLYVPGSVAHHVGSAVTGKRSNFSVYHGHRNLVWTFIKNMPGVLFWALLPLHLVLNIATVIYFAMRGQGKVILRAKWDAIKGIPKMWRKRQLIQSTRIATVSEIWRLMDKRIIPARQCTIGKNWRNSTS
jgi:GT2 family glycosyltransferase